MPFLFNNGATGRFSCESKLRGGFAHGKLVTGNPARTSQLVTYKIHVWGAFLFFGGGYSLSISCSGIPAEMALCRASLLCRFLHLDLGIYRTPFCFDNLQSLSKKIELINCRYHSPVRCSVGDALFCFSRHL